MADGPTGRSRRMVSLSGAEVGAAALAGLFAVAVALVPSTRGSLVAEHLLLALAAAGASVTCALAGRRSRGRPAWSFRFLAVAGACWSAGHLAAAVTRAPNHEMLWWAGVGFPIASPMIIAALLFFPGAPLRWAGRGRTLVDGLIIGACALFVAWELGLAETYRAASSTAAQVALGQTVADIVALGIAVVILTRAPRTARPRLSLAGLALAGLAVADGAQLGHVVTHPGPVLSVFDTGWLAAYLVVAVLALRSRGSEAVANAEALEPGLPTRASVFVPSVPFALALWAGAAEALRQHRYDRFLVRNGLVIVLLVVARQVLALLENISFWRTLEAEVQARASELRRSEARFRSLVQHASDVVTVVSADDTILYQSPSFGTLFGYEAGDLGGRSLYGLIHPDDVGSASRALGEMVDRHRAMGKVECRVLHKDGSWRYVEAVISNLLDDPDVQGLVLNSRDITDRKDLERQLRHQAFHDPLTDLANRDLFHDRVKHALDRTARTGQPIAVVFLDLDDFKTINDSLGHAAGDQLLAAVGMRLLGCVRPVDTVARLGGDEFAILAEDLDDVLDVATMASRILGSLAPSFALSERNVFVGASIGIAINPAGGDSADDLLRSADLAMYTAKSQGKGRYAVFEPRMHAAVMARMEVEADLRRALDTGELVLHFQPIVTLRTRTIVGVEALVRWQHPKLGLINPAYFITIAEESGLIVPLGQWVLEESCRQARRWQDELGAPLFAVSVNLSVKQLREPDFLARVGDALEASHLSPQSLVFEITESTVMEDTAASGRLRELRALGARVAIDDFGTGYSSLSYLRHLPVDILKIDQAFLEGVEPGSQQSALTGAIVSMGHTLGLEMVAEGVEHDPQLSELLTMGCDLGQGYYFARPAAADRITEDLTASKEGTSLFRLLGAGSSSEGPNRFAD